MVERAVHVHTVRGHVPMSLLPRERELGSAAVRERAPRRGGVDAEPEHRGDEPDETRRSSEHVDAHRRRGESHTLLVEVRARLREYPEISFECEAPHAVAEHPPVARE